MQFIDTHAHLYDQAFLGQVDQVIKRAQANGVDRIYMPNLDLSSIKPMLTLAEQYPSIGMPMLGLHPCYVQDDVDKQLQAMATWLDQHAFAAIGEIGIDMHHHTKYQAQQQVALSTQLTWAHKRGLPVVLHCRNSFETVMKALEPYQGSALKGVFHCFSGTKEQAQQVVDLGFYLGIGGLVTFKNSNLAQVIANLSCQHIVLETDSPYLAPVPYRGKRNEPMHLRLIAEHIAAIKGMPVSEVAAITSKNATQLFAC